jgi:hypothetical protein
MMSAFELEVTSDGQSLFHGQGADMDRLEAMIRWYAHSRGAETGIFISEEGIAQWEAYRVEIDPVKSPLGDKLICALDHEFRQSGAFRCLRRWVRGNTWGWLVRHLPGRQWVHDRSQKAQQ